MSVIVAFNYDKKKSFTTSASLFISFNDEQSNSLSKPNTLEDTALLIETYENLKNWTWRNLLGNSKNVKQRTWGKWKDFLGLDFRNVVGKVGKSKNRCQRERNWVKSREILVKIHVSNDAIPQFSSLSHNFSTLFAGSRHLKPELKSTIVSNISAFYFPLEFKLGQELYRRWTSFETKTINIWIWSPRKILPAIPGEMFEDLRWIYLWGIIKIWRFAIHPNDSGIHFISFRIHFGYFLLLSVVHKGGWSGVFLWKSFETIWKSVFVVERFSVFSSFLLNGKIIQFHSIVNACSIECRCCRMWRIKGWTKNVVFWIFLC